MSEYRNHDGAEELEPYFMRHMMALTAESLFSKADIACELAYRDEQLAKAQAEIERMRPVVEASIAYYHATGVDDAATGNAWDNAIRDYEAGEKK